MHVALLQQLRLLFDGGAQPLNLLALLLQLAAHVVERCGGGWSCGRGRFGLRRRRLRMAGDGEHNSDGAHVQRAHDDMTHGETSSCFSGIDANGTCGTRRRLSVK